MKKSKQKNTDVTDPEYIRKRSLIYDFASLRVMNVSAILLDMDINPSVFLNKREKDYACVKVYDLDKFVTEIVYYRNLLKTLLKEDISLKITLSILDTIRQHKAYRKQIWGRKDSRIASIYRKIDKGVALNDDDISIIFKKAQSLLNCISEFIRSIENTSIHHFEYEIPTIRKEKTNYASINKGEKEKIINNLYDILKKKDKGETLKNLAKEYDVSQSSLSNYLKQYREGTLLITKKLAKDVLFENIEGIIDRLNKNENLTVIAKDYNITPRYLCRIVNQYKSAKAQLPNSVYTEDDRIIFGSKLMLLRENNGLSQQELADIVNCNTRYISEIERGILNPRLDLLIKIVKALGKNIDIVD